MKKIYFVTFLIFLIDNSKSCFSSPLKVVAFDCHGVVFKSLPWNVHKEIGRFMWNHYEALPLGLYLAPQILYFCLSESLITVEGLLKKFPVLEKYRDEIYGFVKLQGLNEDVVALIKKLREQGVIIVLASNIHVDALVYNKKLMPEIFELFDILYTCAESNGNYKSEKNYFEHLYTYLSTQLEEHNLCIAYIDDDYSAIKSLEMIQRPIQGFHFTTSQKLENALHEFVYLL